MRRAVPLRPIWTIMVATKLDHSRVLVTTFDQNRSTLKGRSATHRQTDRQTDSAENKGPSGLQSGQQTDRRQTCKRRCGGSNAAEYLIKASRLVIYSCATSVIGHAKLLLGW